jgi:hypothetical protein
MSTPSGAKILDERFFDHRRRSTSIAGMAGGVFACALFLYRLYVDHVWNWDVMAVATVIAVVKLILMIYYRLTD